MTQLIFAAKEQIPWLGSKCRGPGKAVVSANNLQ